MGCQAAKQPSFDERRVGALGPRYFHSKTGGLAWHLQSWVSYGVLVGLALASPAGKHPRPLFFQIAKRIILVRKVVILMRAMADPPLSMMAAKWHPFAGVPLSQYQASWFGDST